MAITLADVIAVLHPEEPDYAKARQLGPDAIPFLQQIVMHSDQMTAAKAAYLAGLIGTAAGAQVVAHAAGSANPALRVAAAAAARELDQDHAALILEKLLADTDGGVRHRAVKSSVGHLTPALRLRLTNMVQHESNRRIRDDARALLGLHP
jgi:HEAT repeat protein